MKTIFTMIALCVGVSAFGQVEKGRSYVNGSLSFSAANQTGTQNDFDNHVSSTSKNKDNSFGINAGYGYLIANQWAIGLGAGYNHGTSTFLDQSRSKTNAANVSAYVRKFFPVFDKLYFYVDGGVGYSNNLSQSKPETSTVWTKSKTETASIFLTPGATYFLSNRFALTASMGSIYFNNRQETDTGPSYRNTYRTNSFATSLSIRSLSLGAAFYF